MEVVDVATWRPKSGLKLSPEVSIEVDVASASTSPGITQSRPGGKIGFVEG